MYAADHLSAAIQLCEIQTVLGRAKSRLLKSWKYVLSLDSSHQTAKEFVEKNADIFYKYIPKKRLKKPYNKKSNKENPFGVLKNLNFN